MKVYNLYDDSKDVSKGHREDVKTIREYLESHGEFVVNIKNTTIENYWYDFSETYCTGWLDPQVELLGCFADWMDEKEI